MSKSPVETKFFKFAIQHFPVSAEEDSLHYFTREFRFHHHRQYRFDFAWPNLKIAVEIQGFAYHSSKKAVIRDYCKYNLAVENDWLVIQVTSGMLTNHQDELQRVIHHTLDNRINLSLKGWHNGRPKFRSI